MPSIDIHERIYCFALGVIRLTVKLPKTTANHVLIKQLIRSSTSIGANAIEAEASSTKKEFIRGFTISKREAKESWYWLRLLSDLNPNHRVSLNEYVQEADELIRIVSTIIINSKKSL